VGFDDDVITLRQLLLSEDHQRQMFISILGESGVGKMTLVKMMMYYKKEMAKARHVFEVPFWFQVPADATVDSVLEGIYKFLISNLNLQRKKALLMISLASSETSWRGRGIWRLSVAYPPKPCSTA
jgi:ABC-type thiamine transport system ATPase subunit